MNAIKLLISSGMAVLTSSAIAADGIEVGGNLNQTVSVGDVKSEMMMGGGKVSQEIGVISGNVTVKGNLNQKIQAGDVKSEMMMGGGSVNQRVGVISGGTVDSITSIFK